MVNVRVWTLSWSTSWSLGIVVILLIDCCIVSTYYKEKLKRV
jgi:hypothetical protein